MFSKASETYFKKTIDVEQLLKSDYLNEIKKLWDLKAVQFFINELPFKMMDLDSNDEPNAHLDISAPSKVLTLLASDNSLEVK